MIPCIKCFLQLSRSISLISTLLCSRTSSQSKIEDLCKLCRAMGACPSGLHDFLSIPSSLLCSCLAFCPFLQESVVIALQQPWLRPVSTCSKVQQSAWRLGVQKNCELHKRCLDSQNLNSIACLIKAAKKPVFVRLSKTMSTRR